MGDREVKKPYIAAQQNPGRRRLLHGLYGFVEHGGSCRKGCMDCISARSGPADKSSRIRACAHGGCAGHEAWAVVIDPVQACRAPKS